MKEACGLRTSDASRPRDLVVLDFATPSRHLVVDGVVTTVYMNSILARVSAVSGLATKKVEDTKFKAYANSAHPVDAIHGGRHTFVPFAMEDGGTTGAHLWPSGPPHASRACGC